MFIAGVTNQVQSNLLASIEYTLRKFLIKYSGFHFYLRNGAKLIVNNRLERSLVGYQRAMLSSSLMQEGDRSLMLYSFNFHSQFLGINIYSPKKQVDRKCREYIRGSTLHI